MSNFSSSIIFWKRNKGYSFICLFGLAISILFVIIIADFTLKEMTTDNFQTKADRIYLLGNEEIFGTAWKLEDHLIPRYPEIEKICAFTKGISPITISGDKYAAMLSFADSTFYDLFDFQLVLGDKQSALTSLNSAIISEEFAHKVFGKEDPMGQIIKIKDFEVTITGVQKDITNSAIPKNDIMLRIENIVHFNPSMASETLGNAGSTILFLLTKEGADISAKSRDMEEYFKTFFWLYRDGACKQVNFTPLREMYFSSIAAGGLLNQGDKTLVLILLSAGILILLFAVINYINLTVAQSGFRAKEMATRRLLGSSRKAIFGKMISEAIIFCYAAYIIGYLLALIFDGYAGNLLGSQINVFKDMTPLYALSSILAIALIGIISGVIPASIISGFEPVEVVRGTFRRRTKMLFSKIFITFQNVITIVLLACSITMIAQVYYMAHAKMRYETENIIVVDNEEFDLPTCNTFRNELKNLACVEQVAFCQGYPLNRGNNYTTMYDGQSISFQSFVGDSVYFDMMKLQIIQDNHTSNQGFWLNETAMKRMGLPIDAEGFSLWEEDWVLAGVLKDFQYGNVMEQIGPAFVRYSDFSKAEPWSFLIKVTGDPFEANNQVESVYKKLSDGAVYEGEFIEEKIQKAYEQQRKTSKILSLFTIIGIVISALGLLAMSTYFIRQRATEIAVRKVMGSSDSEIVKKLLHSFLLLVVVAFVISVPIIWYAMDSWLNTYPQHIKLGIWIYATAGAVTLLIAFLTVIGQSVKSSRANPKDNL